MTKRPEVDALNRIATALEKLNDRDDRYKANQAAAERASKYAGDIARTGAEALAETLNTHSWPFNEPVTPTSELLSEAANVIHDLGLTREVSRPNGWRYAPLVRKLQDRAWAFRQCEDVDK